MADVTPLSQIAALIGDGGRAAMLTMMMDGRAHTAGELAAVADISAATASGHLSKLLQRRLVMVNVQGRHRYYRLFSSDVARMLESILVVTTHSVLPSAANPRVPEALVEARTCYDHIAGRLGVAIADRLLRDSEREMSNGEPGLPRMAGPILEELEIKLEHLRTRSRRLVWRPCLDWSERRTHVAGALGAVLLERLLERRWITRVGTGRALRITATGKPELLRLFGYQRI